MGRGLAADAAKIGDGRSGSSSIRPDKSEIGPYLM